ncbi:MAG: hypothetical protein WAW06_02920, partial [bacterium]
MRRRLLVACLVVVVVALVAWVAYAYVQGAGPFAKSQARNAGDVAAGLPAEGSACGVGAGAVEC